MEQNGAKNYLDFVNSMKLLPKELQSLVFEELTSFLSLKISTDYVT